MGDAVVVLSLCRDSVGGGGFSRKDGRIEHER